MKSLLLFGIASVFSFCANAQKPCDQNELSTRPGKWKESTLKGSLYQVTAKEAAEEQATLNKLDGMIKAGYKPAAIVLIHSNVIGYNAAIGANWIANPYAYSIAFKKYTCINGKEYVNGEAQVDAMASIFVYANSMEWIANIYASDINPEVEDGYVFMADMPVMKDGVYHFNLNKDKIGMHYEAVLITKGNELPFVYVTKKEFLLIRKAKLEKKKQAALLAEDKKNIVRPVAEQEAAKQKEIESLKKENYTQPYIDRYLKDYKTDEQKKEASIARVRKYYDTPLNLINKLLTTSSKEDLATPAIIHYGETYDVFTGFVSDAEGQCLVKPNRAYYNSKLAKSAPQFFSVFYKWDDTLPVYSKAIQDIKPSINFQTLKNMLAR